MKPKFRSLRSMSGSSMATVVVASIAAAASAGAQTTWTGATSQDFSDASNWTAGLPDTAFEIGTINTAVGNTPIISSAIPDPGTNVDFQVGVGGGNSGLLDQSAGSLTTTGWIFAGLDGGTGTINQTGGTMTANSFRVGVGAGVSTGTLNVGGTVTADTFNIGGGANNVATATGTVNVNSGGIVNSEFDVLMAFAGDSSSQATMNIDGGTVNVGSSAERWVVMGQWDSANSTIDVTNGGTLNLNGGTDIVTAQNNNGGNRVINVNGGSIIGTGAANADASFIKLRQGDVFGTDTVNITNGGLVQVQSIYVNSASAGSASVNFNGGTLKAIADDANIIALGNAATHAITTEGAGATIDTNGFSVGINEAISGAGGLTVAGGGTLTLGGTSTYTGDTTVSAGTLLVTGALGNSAVSVATGATIGGSGSIAGALDFATGASFLFSETDTLTVAGLVTFGGFGISDISGLDNTVANGTYTLIDGVVDFTNVTDVGLANAVDLGGGKSAYLQEGSLQLVVIPEPSAALLGGIGVLALLRRRRG